MGIAWEGVDRVLETFNAGEIMSSSEISAAIDKAWSEYCRLEKRDTKISVTFQDVTLSISVISNATEELFKHAVYPLIEASYKYNKNNLISPATSEGE